MVEGVLFEKRPAKTPDGGAAGGLYNAWITLDNHSPNSLNFEGNNHGKSKPKI